MNTVAATPFFILFTYSTSCTMRFCLNQKATEFHWPRVPFFQFTIKPTDHNLFADWPDEERARVSSFHCIAVPWQAQYKEIEWLKTLNRQSFSFKAIIFAWKIVRRLWNIYGLGLLISKRRECSAGWVRERRCLWFKLTQQFPFCSLSLGRRAGFRCCCCWPT
jgi:hypothetical protein